MMNSKRKIKKKLILRGRSKRRVVYIKKKTSKTFLIFTPLLILILGIILLIYLIPYEAHYINNNSMTPVIEARDVVIIQTNIDKSELKPNDIIAFDLKLGNDSTETLVKYIYDIELQNGMRTYRTIKEGSTEPDAWLLTDEEVIGIYVLKIDKLGNLILFLQSFVGQMVIVINIILIYVLVYLSKGTKSKDRPYT